jgi:thymidylate kinase
MNNPKLIIFEGMDRTGKTTLMKKVWELRGRVDCCVDRYIVSNITYNSYFNRQIDSIDYLAFLPDIPDVIIVYITSTYTDYKQRAISTEGSYMSYDEWRAQLKAFESTIANVRKNWLKNGRIIAINNHNGINIDVLAQIVVNEIGD